MLNNIQKEIHNSIVKTVNKVYLNQEKQVIKVSGEAGAGKTYLTSVLIESLIKTNADYKILVTTISHCALTNFKANIQKSASGDVLTKITFKTIASLLKQFPMINTGGFSRANGENIKNYDLIIVDEFSNVGDSKSKVICENLSEGSTVIFLGDDAQLPPVLDAKSQISRADKAIAMVYGIPIVCFDLKSQMRQTGNIYELSKICRKKVYYPTKDDSICHSDDVILHCDRDAMVTVAVERIEKHGLNSTCLYSFTNKECNYLAELVRKKLNKTSKILNVDDVVNVFKGNNYCHTGTTIAIKSISEFSEPLFNLPLLHINLKYYAFHRNHRDRYNLILDSLRASWKETKDKQVSTLINFYSDLICVGYPYSRTLHSIQGVTVDYAFISSPDLKTCKYAQKNLLYVATSRARKELHFAIT